MGNEGWYLGDGRRVYWQGDHDKRVAGWFMGSWPTVICFKFERFVSSSLGERVENVPANAWP